MTSIGSFYKQEIYDKQGIVILLILLLVYTVIFQITPGDDNYLLVLLGENKWQYTGLYDTLQ